MPDGPTYKPQLPDILPVGCTEFPESEWRAWRAGVVDRFLDLCGEGPAEAAEPALRVESEVDEGAWVRRLVSYETEPGDRCPAWLLVPKGVSAASPAPAVLCLHGTTADAKDACLGIGGHPGGANGIAVHLARRGFVTLSPDHFCAGARLPEGVPPYNTAFFYERHPGWSEMGKDVFDHRQALNVLCSRPEVDGSRLGCIGHSLGGYGTAFLAAVDDRVRAAVSSCGVTSWLVDPKRENWSRTPPGRYKHFQKLRPYFESGQAPPLDMHEILASIAPRALLNISAVGNDVCFPVFEPFAEIYYQVERVYKALQAEGKFACHFHSAGHSFNAPPRALAYCWLEMQLGLEPVLDG
ncbi:MAG: prolyl oligopeptidase family serine peptidase [Lentisphaeria bacterium]|nr:prolyl oligopeptidase family serine peptidase [Lentisphaeria bacterium]